MRQFYNDFIYPKLHPHQKTWVVPGRFPAGTQQLSARLLSHRFIVAGLTNPEPIKQGALNQSSFVAMMAGFAAWSAEDPLMVGWLPWHFDAWGDPTADPVGLFVYGAKQLPEALAYIKSQLPPKSLP